MKEHEANMKQCQREHRAALRALRQKHQVILNGLLESSIVERQNLRDGMEKQMNKLAQQQEESTQELKRVVEEDFKVMRKAIAAEEKRIVEAETRSFNKAQTLISAQVFHEVRNALSAVISMSEMTSDLKEDESISPRDLGKLYSTSLTCLAHTKMLFLIEI